MLITLCRSVLCCQNDSVFPPSIKQILSEHAKLSRTAPLSPFNLAQADKLCIFSLFLFFFAFFYPADLKAQQSPYPSQDRSTPCSWTARGRALLSLDRREGFPWAEPPNIGLPSSAQVHDVCCSHEEIGLKLSICSSLKPKLWACFIWPFIILTALVWQKNQEKHNVSERKRMVCNTKSKYVNDQYIILGNLQGVLYCLSWVLGRYLEGFEFDEQIFFGFWINKMVLHSHSCFPGGVKFESEEIWVESKDRFLFFIITIHEC